MLFERMCVLDMGVKKKDIHAFPYVDIVSGGCLNPECRKIKDAMPLEALHEDSSHHNSVLFGCPYCRREYIGVRTGIKSDIDVISQNDTYVYPKVEEYPNLPMEIAEA